MAAPPPKITIAPPPKKARGNDFDRFINAHPALKAYKTTIQQWAGEFGVPALWVAATLLFESNGDPLAGTGRNGKPINPTGYGLGQINPKAWFGKTFAPTGETITQQWADKPANQIAFAAWLLSTSHAGNLTGAYKDVYNNGYTGTGAGGRDPKGLGPALYLKGYNVTVSGTTPQQAATGAAARAAARAALPADEVLQARQFLDPIFLAYTGRKASKNDVAFYLKTRHSQYQIEQDLANPKNNPRIFKSPIWASNYGKYDAYYRSIFGPDKAPPRGVLLYAITHNLDATAFTQELRNGQLPGAPDYSTSEEYKGNFASAQKVYTNIYGLPDYVGKQFIDQAVRKGWNQDQIEQTLRAQPEYTQSGEYKARAIDLASRMGLIQGTAGGAQTALAGMPNG